MRTIDFEYNLPAELIAQKPAEPRDSSRLMVLDRTDNSIEHRRFSDITEYLRDGDVLVFNDSRVIPARLRGRRVDSGGKVEILLLRRLDSGVWEALVRPAKRLKTGAAIEITNGSAAGKQSAAGIMAEIIGVGQDGTRVISFSDEALLLDSGEVPLPPYIHTPLENTERYQTVYARVAGSVAAPTAGLHFTTGLIDEIERKGVMCLFVTLHVGLDTFRPVTEDDPLEHMIYKEYGTLGETMANELSRAKNEGRRIICVGTTTARILEQTAQVSSPLHLKPFAGWVSLFILPGYKFRLVDALLTNFHLPRSTLLMLVTSFAGKALTDKSYQEAIAQRYRFYSFGDAMLII